MEIIKGVVYRIDPVVKFSDKFSKKQFVIQEDLVTKFGQYTSHYQIQATNTKIPMLDSVYVGQEVTVTVSISGRKYNNKTTGEEGFVISLDLMKIEGNHQFNNQGHQIMTDHPAGYTPAMAAAGVIPPMPKNSLNGLGIQPVRLPVGEDPIADAFDSQPVAEDDLPF
jgi:hypothetical protein